MVVYDITYKDSFDNIKMWMNEIDKYFFIVFGETWRSSARDVNETGDPTLLRSISSINLTILISCILPKSRISSLTRPV